MLNARRKRDFEKVRHFTELILRAIRDEEAAFTRLEPYPGMEVPLPLEVEICQGEADTEQVLNDVSGLTKLNCNSCR